MNRSTQRAILGQIETYARRIQDLEARLERLNQFEGFENLPNETVITFEKQFHPGTQWYSYAAIKAAGRWYTTGPKSPKAYTSDEMLRFIEDAREVRVVTESRPIEYRLRDLKEETY